MIKKQVSYTDIEDNKVTETIIFHFSVPGMRNFEQLTGKNFFKAYSKAFEEFTGYVSDLESLQDVENNPDLAMKLFPMLTNETINEFVVSYIQAFYAILENGRFVQNEMTMDEAGDSLWLSEILNIDLFMEIFEELNKNKVSPKKKKATRIKK